MSHYESRIGNLENEIKEIGEGCDSLLNILKSRDEYIFSIEKEIASLKDELEFLNERGQEDYDEIRSNISYKNWHGRKLEKRIELIEESLSEMIEWRNSVPYIDAILEGDKITLKRTDGRKSDECPFCGTKISSKCDEDCGCSEKN